MDSTTSLPNNVLLKKARPSKIFAVTSANALNVKTEPVIFVKSDDLNQANTPLTGSKFGTHLACIRTSCLHRTVNASNYSTMSDGGLYTSDEPCSSAQAEFRLAAHWESTFTRTREIHCDTGYSSQSPPETTVFIQKSRFPVAEKPGTPELKSFESKKLVQKKSGNASTPTRKLASEEKKAKNTSMGRTPSKLKSPKALKMVKKENEPAIPPNHFEGKVYGYLVDDMSAIGIQPILDKYNEDPEKFFKRFDSKPWFRRKVMPLLFGKSHKSPADVVKTLREVLTILDKLPPPKLDKDGNIQSDKKYDKALDEVSKNVAMIKSFIYGNDSAEPSSEHVVQVAQLAQEVYNANILPMLIKMLPKFEFECKKDVGQIFNNLLRRQIGTRSPTVEYLGARPEILIQLVQGYSVPDIALTCGLMLRESIRHDHLAKIILYSDVFYTFFLYVQSEVFDISSDAFSTFKELTTRHKAIIAEFLDSNYDTFFAQYQNLLNSKNYVTRRQSLKLLGELLLDRHNFNTMTKYISNPDNLRLMMELLRDKSRNIQYEAFHVFKVFVANPNKPKPISDILNRNREKLVEFLSEFHNDRTDDEQFNDEKAYLIKQIQEMKSSPKEAKKPKSKEDENQEPAGPSEGPSTSQ